MLEKYSYINYTKLPEFDCHILSGNTDMLEQRITNLLCSNGKEKTAEHVISVADTCVQVAEKFGLDTAKARVCGLLHDISAVISPRDMTAYAVGENWYMDESEKKYPFILHQRISAVIAGEDFYIRDKSVLSAVECHSTLKYNPSDYDMVLFLSDKLSWDKEETAPFYEIVSEALEKSLISAVCAYFDFAIKNGLILQPHKWFIEARNWLNFFQK